MLYYLTFSPFLRHGGGPTVVWRVLGLWALDWGCETVNASGVYTSHSEYNYEIECNKTSGYVGNHGFVSSVSNYTHS